MSLTCCCALRAAAAATVVATAATAVIAQFSPGGAGNAGSGGTKNVAATGRRLRAPQPSSPPAQRTPTQHRPGRHTSPCPAPYPGPSPIQFPLRAAISWATYGRRHRRPNSGPGDSTPHHPLPSTRSTPVDTEALFAGRFSPHSVARTCHLAAPAVVRWRWWRRRRWRCRWRRRAAACYRRGPTIAVVAAALLPRRGRREAGCLPHRAKFSHSRRRCHRLNGLLNRRCRHVPRPPLQGRTPRTRWQIRRRRRWSRRQQPRGYAVAEASMAVAAAAATRVSRDRCLCRRRRRQRHCRP